MERVLDSKKVFVFGSNLRGLHGAGAALDAKMYYGATYGVGKGRQGQSYAIPTRDKWLQTLPLEEIRMHVHDFLDYARSHGREEFLVTRIGCGLAGYNDEQIAPMFENAPANCELPRMWRLLIQQYREHRRALAKPPEGSALVFGLQLFAVLIVAVLCLWWLFR